MAVLLLPGLHSSATNMYARGQYLNGACIASNVRALYYFRKMAIFLSHAG
jgi:hypothetical protein